MADRVFLAGGLGAVGRHCITLLRDQGYEVLATTRRRECAPEIEALGAQPAILDVFDSEAVHATLRDFAPTFVLNQLTALPHRLPNPRRIAKDMALTNRLRGEVTPTLIKAAEEAGANRVVTQSISFAYAPGGECKTEEDPLYLDCPTPFRGLVEAVQTCEQATLESSIEGVVLRFGLFYGPGTYYADDGDASVQIRRRRLPIVRGGAATCSLIHVRDAAAASVAALTSASTGIFNIVDDEPVAMAQFTREFAALRGAKPPYQIPKWVARLGAGPYGVFLLCDQVAC
ncbi:MAG: NAD(P)-dependent oxidoreductase, partial [Myxococcales bacterium]|nr:NAD(P)-dependent oxidoreductase [Myxococcales bacterium]